MLLYACSDNEYTRQGLVSKDLNRVISVFRLCVLVLTWDIYKINIVGELFVLVMCMNAYSDMDKFKEQLICKDPDRAISLLLAATKAGDQVDSTLKRDDSCYGTVNACEEERGYIIYF